MASYATFSTTRLTLPDPVALTAAVKTATGDPTAVIATVPGVGWRAKKAAGWTAGDISATQTALDTVAAFDDAVFDLDQKVMRAVLSALWECIPAATMTKVQARARAIAIYKTL